MLEIACGANVGVISKKNDDKVLVNNTIIEEGFYSVNAGDNCIAVICDGVGGEKYGDQAALLCIRKFSAIELGSASIDTIDEKIFEANREVLEFQKTEHMPSNAATTVAGVLVKGNDIYAFNVGDTRVYRFREPYIGQLSKDHSLAAYRKEMRLPVGDSDKHILTMYIGEKHIEPFYYEGCEKFFDNDIYIICSDGVYDKLSEIEFENFFKENESIEDICKIAISKAIENGSEDNLSIIIIRRR